MTIGDFINTSLHRCWRRWSPTWCPFFVSYLLPNDKALNRLFVLDGRTKFAQAAYDQFAGYCRSSTVVVLPLYFLMVFLSSLSVRSEWSRRKVPVPFFVVLVSQCNLSRPRRSRSLSCQTGAIIMLKLFTFFIVYDATCFLPERALGLLRSMLK